MNILQILVTLLIAVHFLFSIPDTIQYDRHYENQTRGGCAIDDCSPDFIARVSNPQDGYWTAWKMAGLE